jgi:hypothetical protein
LYIGWRGEDKQHPNPANEVPSLLSRHDAAARLSEGGLSDVLQSLSFASKSLTDSLREPARFIVVGHSFGGLIVTRMTARTLGKDFAPNHPAAPLHCSTTNETTGHRSYADLIVAINAADSSIRAAELMRTMKLDAKTSPDFFCPSQDRTAEGLPRPILVSIHTASDDATSGAGHIGLSLRRYDGRYPGRTNLDLTKQYDTPNNSELAPTFGALQRDPINHLNYLHTLCYLDQDGNGDWICDRVNELITLAKASAYKTAGLGPPSDLKRGAYELVMAQCGGQDVDKNESGTAVCDAASLERRERLRKAMFSALKPYLAIQSEVQYGQPTRLLNLYTRLDSGCKGLNSTDTNDGRPLCDPTEGYQPEWPDGEPGYKHPPVAPWNNTQFWEFNVPYHMIQEHSGFWNEEVITLITGISSAFDVVPAN